MDEVLADGGYTQLRDFLGFLREADIEVTFRLHGTNQEGVRGSAHDGAVFIVDGRPHCSCVPDKTLKYPWQPQRDKTDYLQRLAWRAQWELVRMQTTKSGRVRFRSPHHGTGCMHCAGKKPDERCCQQQTYTISPELLRLSQRERHGSPEWKASYSRRSRVEGFFSTLKDPARTNLSRGTARFFDFGKISLATLLRTVATNFDRLDAYQKLIDNGAEPDTAWRGKESLTDYMPDAAPTTVAAPVAGGSKPRAKRAPPGLAHLAVDP